MNLINTNLEKEFNLAPANLLDEDEVASEESDKLAIVDGPTTINHYEKIDKIESGLPQVSGLDAADEELDELAEYGIKAHKELLELAANVEQRFIGDIASAAGNMLGHAIAAKTNKIKKKLDMIELQIKKQVADFKTQNPEDSNKPLIGEGQIVDRTELLRQLLKDNPQNVKKE